MADSIALLSLLIALELVLGVDNILVISIFVARLSESQRNNSIILGLAIALLARILMLLRVKSQYVFLANISPLLQKKFQRV